MNKIVGIYKITSPNNNIYIGQSNDINKRFYLYKKMRCKSQIKLYNSLVKYGQENHKFDIICECSKDELNDLEIKYINEYNSFNSKNGLNLKSGGRSGGCLSDESKDKIRQKAIGRISKIKGVPKSEETKLKLSLINKGKKHSEETKIKQSLYAKEMGFKPPIMTRDKCKPENLLKKKNDWSKEKNPNYNNRLMTEEHKKKLLIANLGKKQTDEQKKLVSLRFKNKPKTDEQRLRMSLASKGKKKSPESIKKRMETIRKKREQKLLLDGGSR